MNEMSMVDGLLMSSWRVLVLVRGTPLCTYSIAMVIPIINRTETIFNISLFLSNSKDTIKQIPIASGVILLDIHGIKIIFILDKSWILNNLTIEKFYHNYHILAQRQKITVTTIANKKQNIIFGGNIKDIKNV